MQKIEQSSVRWCVFKPGNRILHWPVPVIPIINVALLVALFMMLDSAFVLRPGVVVELPEADFVSGSRYGAMVVTLTQEGKVFFNDEWMPMDELEFAIRQAAHGRDDLSLIIEADARVPYGSIIRVMNMATAARVRRLDLSTRPFSGEELHHESPGT